MSAARRLQREAARAERRQVDRDRKDNVRERRQAIAANDALQQQHSGALAALGDNWTSVELPGRPQLVPPHQPERRLPPPKRAVLEAIVAQTLRRQRGSASGKSAASSTVSGGQRRQRD